MSNQARFMDIPTPQRRSQEGAAKEEVAPQGQSREAEQPQKSPNQQARQAGDSTLKAAMNKQPELSKDGQEQAAQAAPPTLKAATSHGREQNGADQEGTLSPNQQALKQAPANLKGAMNRKNDLSPEVGDEGKGKETEKGKGELSRPTHESYYQPVPVNGMAPPERGGRGGRGLSR